MTKFPAKAEVSTFYRMKSFSLRNMEAPKILVEDCTYYH
jgi:hypothetical protein